MQHDVLRHIVRLTRRTDVMAHEPQRSSSAVAQEDQAACVAAKRSAADEQGGRRALVKQPAIYVNHEGDAFKQPPYQAMLELLTKGAYIQGPAQRIEQRPCLRPVLTKPKAS